MEYYNSERLNSALHYLTPEDFLLGGISKRIAERKNKLLELSLGDLREIFSIRYLKYLINLLFGERKQINQLVFHFAVINYMLR